MFHHSGYVLAACLSPSNWGTTECVIIKYINRFAHFPVMYCCLSVIVVHEMHSQMHHNHHQITILLAHDRPPFIVGLPCCDPSPSCSRQFS